MEEMLHLRAHFYGIKLQTDVLNLDWKSREGVTQALKIRVEWLVQGGVRKWAPVGLARKYRIFGWPLTCLPNNLLSSSVESGG